MTRRLPDDLTAALAGLDADDLRRASRGLGSSDRQMAEAQELALALDRDRALDRALDSNLDLARDLALALDRDRALDRALDSALDLDLDVALARDLALDHDLERARAGARDLVIARALVRARTLDLDLVLDRAFARQHSRRVHDWLEVRAVELDVAPEALWASLLIQRWWQVLVVVWAISVDEPEIRNTAFRQDEADRARGQLEGVDRSWQNIELDPQVELDPGDEEFIHAQLTTIRSQLILDGIPEIIDRALAALYERFAHRADHEAIIRSALAEHEPPWSDEDVDWLLGEYQRANDLVAKVSTDDEKAAGKAHTEIKETLGGEIPPPAPGDGRAAEPPIQCDESSASQRGSPSRRVGDAVLTGAGRQLGRETTSIVIDLIADNTDSPWFRALWETVKALGKDWPFSM